MKINEKNLTAFAISGEQVDRDGYLMKKGDGSNSRNYSKRWFVLKGNLLFYFEKKSDREPIGLIILEGSTIELAETEMEENFCFKIVFPTKSYVLGAESHQVMEQWMKALACASYDYIKLMAAELERQLDDLSAEELSASGTGPPAPASWNSSSIQMQNQQNEGRIVQNSYQQRVPPCPSVPTPPPRTKNIKNQPNVRPPKDPRRTFKHLHEEYGTKILLDQKRRWSTTTSVPLSLSKEKESTLIEF